MVQAPEYMWDSHVSVLLDMPLITSPWPPHARHRSSATCRTGSCARSRSTACCLQAMQMMQVQELFAEYATRARTRRSRHGSMHTCSTDAADLGEQVADGSLRVQQNSTQFAPRCSVFESGALRTVAFLSHTDENITYRRQTEDQALCK